MTRLPLPAAALLAATAALGTTLAGCAGSRPAPTRAQQAALADCRRQADSAFVKQHPELLTDQDQLRFSPFSSTATVGVTSAGLGEEFGRNQDFQACLNNSAAGSGAGSLPSGRETISPAGGSSGGSIGPVMTPGGASSLTPGSRP